MQAENNTLLSNLPASELHTLTGSMRLVSLKKGQTLFRRGEVTRHVYFPVGAAISMMVDTEDGSTLETHMLGKTCMVGAGAVGQPSFYRAYVRMAGLAYQLDAETFESRRALCPTFQRNSHAALIRTLMQTSQTLVCSKLHSSEQQLIRWLLTALDRTVGDNLSITHRELAEILGFRREVVTVNLNQLVRQHALSLRRGVVQVLDRTLLETRSCDCYWVGLQRTRPLQSTDR